MSREFDDRVNASWMRFEERLMTRLAEIGEGSFAVSVVGEPMEDRCLPYVQFAGDGDRILGEVSGQQFLDPAYGLDDNQAQTLMVLGWNAPDGEDRPNWWYEVPYDQREVLRSMVTETFRLVFSVVHPQFLESDALGLGEDDVEPTNVPRPPLVEFPASGDELVAMVEATLAPTYGPEVLRDTDGDFPIYSGVVPLWIRIHDDRLAVRVFSYVVCGLQNPSQAVIEVGILNRRTPLLKFYSAGDLVVAAIDLPAVPFVGAQLTQTLDEVRDLLNDLASDLALRVAGYLFFDRITPSDIEESA